MLRGRHGDFRHQGGPLCLTVKGPYVILHADARVAPRAKTPPCNAIAPGALVASMGALRAYQFAPRCLTGMAMKGRLRPCAVTQPFRIEDFQRVVEGAPRLPRHTPPPPL